MKLLAIDTSTDIASVALLIGDTLYTDSQPGLKSHAQLLLPMIDQLMNQADAHLSQLDGIIFGCGPGSFTGLRITCSVAKGLAYAHNLDLIPVSSLGAIAQAAREQMAFEDTPILAVLDARMQEMYWGYFDKQCMQAEEKVTAAKDILIPNAENLVLAGVGIDAYWEALPLDLKQQISTKITCYPSAAAMIRLTLRAGINPVSIDKAQPVYVRNQVTQGDKRG